MRARFSAWDVVVGGYAAATLALLLDLPTIGSSGTSAVATIAIGLLIATGIVLVAAGLLQLRRAAAQDQREARRGLEMQSVGLIVFLLGVLGLQVSSSLAVFVVAAVLVLAASVLAVVGGISLRQHCSALGVESTRDVSYFVFGTALVFVGVWVILGSKIGYYFVFPDVTSTVVNDVGAAISAVGCVVAAYSAFRMRDSRRRVSVPIPEGADVHAGSRVADSQIASSS